jgi:hypothetical protein
MRERDRENERERERAESAGVLKAFLIKSVSQLACVITLKMRLKNGVYQYVSR